VVTEFIKNFLEVPLNLYRVVNLVAGSRLSVCLLLMSGVINSATLFTC